MRNFNLQKWLEGKLPAKYTGKGKIHGTIKVMAHGFTLGAVALLIPSVVLILIYRSGVELHETEWVDLALIIWKAHATICILAILCWLVERPRFAKYYHSEVTEHPDE